MGRGFQGARISGSGSTSGNRVEQAQWQFACLLLRLSLHDKVTSSTKSDSEFQLNTSLLNDLAAVYNLRKIFRNAVFFACAVLLLPHMLPAQDSKPSKIPDGEAQFTPQQLEQYYLVYTNPDVRYLRTLFDAYLKNSGGTEQERQVMNKWSKEYLRSKFIVLSRMGNTFGGTLITVLFQDRPDKVFVAWVYPEGADKKLTLKAFDVGDFSDEDIRRTKIRYKKLIEDKTHAM